jgi:hypothetical protein
MKEKVACVVWALYLTITLTYVLSYGKIEPVYSKLLYLYPSALTAMFCAVSMLSGFDNTTHRAFVVLCVSALAGTLFLIALYWHFPMPDYKYKIGGFLLVELITASCIFKAGKKHGLFENENTNRMP